jgi:hypothetical protein
VGSPAYGVFFPGDHAGGCRNTKKARRSGPSVCMGVAPGCQAVLIFTSLSNTLFAFAISFAVSFGVGFPFAVAVTLPAW